MNASAALESGLLTQQEVGARIAELRIERRLSQKLVAEAIGVDPSAISRIESGDRGLAIDELVGLADYFAVGTDDLLRAKVDATPLFRNEGGAAEGSRALSEIEAIIDDFFAFEVATRA